MLSIIQLNNLRDAAVNAMACERSTGIPCELTLSQWALESGWGNHTPGNNCFGIKQYAGCWDKQLLHTYEYFTVGERDLWLNHTPGRTATVYDATPRQDGRIKYICQDWFASFPNLAACFIKRASLFQFNKRYAPHLDQYLKDRNLVTYVQAIAPIYATDPNYGAEVLRIASIKEVRDLIQELREHK